MYYEEKVIRGVLKFRTEPQGKWMVVPVSTLTVLYAQAKGEIARLSALVDLLNDQLNDYENGRDPHSIS